MSKAIKMLLWPFAIIYGAITRIRNILYEYNIFRSGRVQIKTLVVGNLRVGGTGKTPFVEWLTHFFLNQGTEFCILSRGYGRSTNGFLEANEQSTSNDIGDEPMQYYTKFGPMGVKVFVGEDRVEAIEHIHKLYSTVSLVILDDAYQHRSLFADRYVLLTEFERPFYNDHMLPMGRLRESRYGACRADAVVVTKSPSNALLQKQVVYKEIGKYINPITPIFFNRIQYTTLKPLFRHFLPETINDVILISGIANPANFISHCKSEYNVLEVFVFADHHAFKEEEVQEIIYKASFHGENVMIVTTEKDAMRLFGFSRLFLKCPIAFLPIANSFMDIEEENNFKNSLLSWFA